MNSVELEKELQRTKRSELQAKLAAVRTDGRTLRSEFENMSKRFATLDHEYEAKQTVVLQILDALNSHRDAKPGELGFPDPKDVEAWQKHYTALEAKLKEAIAERDLARDNRETLRRDIVKTGTALNRMLYSEKNLTDALAGVGRVATY